MSDFLINERKVHYFTDKTRIKKVFWEATVCSLDLNYSVKDARTNSFEKTELKGRMK